MNLFADVVVENLNRGQQFQHSRKDSQEQHSFRNHHHVFSKKFFVYPSLFHQDNK